MVRSHNLKERSCNEYGNNLDVHILEIYIITQLRKNIQLKVLQIEPLYSFKGV